MFIHKRDPLQPKEGTETPESVYFSRRKWLQAAGLGTAAFAAGGYAAWRWWPASDEQVLSSGRVEELITQVEQTQQGTAKRKPILSYYPFPRDEQFEYGREETDRRAAARYTNFYEFSSGKQVHRSIGPFRPYPWQITVTGLCRNELTLDISEFYHRYESDFRERQYRHRCVETWAMAIPWTGIPLARLLQDADPLPRANHVLFKTFVRPEEAKRQLEKQFPWPYTEGLTLAEAMNELTFLATGVYGQPLLKQHGAPIRLVVPWQYGFKSIKSIVRIELTDYEPPTFWSTLFPDRYPFQSNVDPQVQLTPWPQHTEWMLGTKERHPTQKFNGYGEYVAHLYKA